MKRVVIIASTQGSVFFAALPYIKKSIYCVVSDRECGAINIARKNGIKTILLPSKGGEEFSQKLCGAFSGIHIDLFLSFYTRLFKKNFLEFTRNKLINFHPSILPACPGMNGFEDSVNHGCCMIGSTVHFVNEEADAGKPIMQAAIPYDPNLSIALNRHKIYEQQCKELIQLVEWLNEDRISGETVIDASYRLSEFSPNLDSADALAFSAEFVLD